MHKKPGLGRAFCVSQGKYAGKWVIQRSEATKDLLLLQQVSKQILRVAQDDPSFLVRVPQAVTDGLRVRRGAELLKRTLELTADGLRIVRFNGITLH